MAEAVQRRSRLRKAWENLVLRTAAYYALLLGGAAALWQWFPGPMRLLHQGLLGERTAAGESVGRNALQNAITQPLFGSAWSSDTVSATVAMIVAGMVALPVAWIYILTRQKKGFRQSQVQTLVMLPVVVAGVVVLVKNSLALAFSLAGIVAAVRFRNTLEDSKDAVYIFVATGIGLAAGVDVPVAVALSIIFNVVVLALWYADLGRSSAALEGTVAERRLQQLRAHANRPSGFVQRLDEEVLESLSADQLDALAERARRRRRRHAPERQFERFDSMLRIQASDVDAAMQAAEPLLGQYIKRWKFGGVVHQSDGTHIIEYAVQFKKRAASGELIDDLQLRGAPAILGVEIR